MQKQIEKMIIDESWTSNPDHNVEIGIRLKLINYLVLVTREFIVPR